MYNYKLIKRVKNSTGIAVDISSKALFVAGENALKFKLSDRIKFLRSTF